MKNNSLSKKGLSMSQAQSISNLCNQRSRDISSKLSNINNFSRKIKIGEKEYIETKKNEIPQDVVSLLKEKSNLHATQAFLMENIKAKDILIKSIQQEKFNYEDKFPSPKYPELLPFNPKSQVTEEWAWEQMEIKDFNIFLEAESYAAHIGQFIHKGGILDKLRTELPTIKTLEFIEIEQGKQSPMEVEIHHTPEQLIKIHEELAALHRGYEQKVNYYKSQTKNLVTSQNALIAQENAEGSSRINSENKLLLEEYNKEQQIWIGESQKQREIFEKDRQKRIEEAVSLKIEVDPLFQSIIDIFLEQLK